jgi:hypothetical protein
MSNYSQIINSSNQGLAISEAGGLVISPSQINEFMSREQIDEFYATNGWGKVEYSKQASSINTYIGMVTAVCPVRIEGNNFTKTIHRVNFSEGNYNLYGEGDKKSNYLDPFLSKPHSQGNITVITPSMVPDGGIFTFFDANGLTETSIFAPAQGLGKLVFKLTLSAMSNTVASLGTDPNVQAQLQKLQREILASLLAACTKYGIDSTKQFDVAVVGLVSNLSHTHNSGYTYPSITLTTPVFNLYIRSCKISTQPGMIINKLQAVASNLGLKEEDFLRKVKLNTQEESEAMHNQTVSLATELKNDFGKVVKTVQFEENLAPTVNKPTSLFNLIGEAGGTVEQALALAYYTLFSYHGSTYGIEPASACLIIQQALGNSFENLKAVMQRVYNAPSQELVAELTNVYSRVKDYTPAQLREIVTYASSNKVRLSEAIKAVLAPPTTTPVVSASESNIVETPAQRTSVASKELPSTVLPTPVDNSLDEFLSEDYTSTDVTELGAEISGFGVDSVATSNSKEESPFSEETIPPGELMKEIGAKFEATFTTATTPSTMATNLLGAISDSSDDYVPVAGSNNCGLKI